MVGLIILIGIKFDFSVGIVLIYYVNSFGGLCVEWLKMSCDICNSLFFNNDNIIDNISI